ARQREAYEVVIRGGIRAWVAGGAGAKGASASSSAGAGVSQATTDDEEEEEEEAGRTIRPRRRSGKGRGKDTDAEREAEEEERRRAAEASVKRGAPPTGEKHVNNMKLQNTVMQLRKVCSHPFLFASLDDDVWALPPTYARAARRARGGGPRRELEALLDRSPEVFAGCGTGWRSEADGKGQAAFAVFEPPPDAGSEALAGRMGEE
ncbi:hypothetical protein B0H13DRAFT_1890678, partial [Mycena leptocephala]